MFAPMMAVTSQEPGKGCERVTPGGQCDNVGTGRDHGAMVGYGGHSDRDTAQWEQLTPPHGQCWTLLFPGLEDINPVSPASEFQPTAARIKTT